MFHAIHKVIPSNLSHTYFDCLGWLVWGCVTEKFCKDSSVSCPFGCWSQLTCFVLFNQVLCWELALQELPLEKCTSLQKRKDICIKLTCILPLIMITNYAHTSTQLPPSALPTCMKPLILPIYGRYLLTSVMQGGNRGVFVR